MPLFGHKNQEPVPPPQQQPVHTRDNRTSTSSGRGLFSRRRSSSSISDMDNRHSRNNRHNTTNTTNSHLSKRSSASHGGGGGLFSRNHGEDPSISGARERVMSAEQAERDADSALQRAKLSVRQAREEVKKLELEAKEEARLAKIKQDAAAGIGKRSDGLGRHERRIF